MGRGWANLSVVAIALAALGGCCPDNEGRDDKRLNCNLSPASGTIVTVKGTAEYGLFVSGDAVVDGISYSDGKNMVFVPDPKQPFSVTVELEVGDSFESSSYGYTTFGAISAMDTFTPADGSAVMDFHQSCWTGVFPGP